VLARDVGRVVGVRAPAGARPDVDEGARCCREQRRQDHRGEHRGGGQVDVEQVLPGARVGLVGGRPVEGAGGVDHRVQRPLCEHPVEGSPYPHPVVHVDAVDLGPTGAPLGRGAQSRLVPSPQHDVLAGGCTVGGDRPPDVAGRADDESTGHRDILAAAWQRGVPSHRPRPAASVRPGTGRAGRTARPTRRRRAAAGGADLRELLEVAFARRARREQDEHLDRRAGLVAEPVHPAGRDVDEVARGAPDPRASVEDAHLPDST
jgi:hypothetical protein